MNITQFLYIFICLYIIKQTNTEDIDVIIFELEMTDLELQDECENLANSYKKSIINQNYSEAVIKYDEILSKKLLYFV